MPSNIAARARHSERMNAACVLYCSRMAQASAGMCMSSSSSDVDTKASGGFSGCDAGDPLVTCDMTSAASRRA